MLKVDDWTQLDLGVRYDMNLPKNNIIWRVGLKMSPMKNSGPRPLVVT